MKKLKIKIFCIFNCFTTFHFLYIFLILYNIFKGNPNQENDFVILSGVTSTLEEAAEIIKGISGFINSLKTMVSVISDIISLRVILLFIVVSIIGSGLSFLGIPRGRVSFFFSLFIADIFWFIWIKNLSTDSIDLINKVFTIIKTNLILIIPFIIIYLFKSKSILRRSGINLISKIMLFQRNKKSLKRNQAVNITENFQEKSSSLQKSLFKDIVAHKDNDDIVISADTLKHKKELEELLKELK